MSLLYFFMFFVATLFFGSSTLDKDTSVLKNENIKPPSSWLANSPIRKIVNHVKQTRFHFNNFRLEVYENIEHKGDIDSSLVALNLGSKNHHFSDISYSDLDLQDIKDSLNNEVSGKLISDSIDTNIQFIGEELTYPFVLHPRRKTVLSAEVDAPIKKIQYRMGDKFEKGDTLIVIDSELYQSKYEKALSFLEKAEAKYKATQQLYNDNFASDFELQDAKAELADAKSEIIQAIRNLKATQVSAPYDGQVVSVFAEEYELPPQKKELIEIIDDEILVAKLLVKASDLDKLHTNQKIKIKIASNGNIVTGKLTRIGAMIDPSSSTVKVEAEIDNRDGKFKAGMVGTATILALNNK